MKIRRRWPDPKTGRIIDHSEEDDPHEFHPFGDYMFGAARGGGAQAANAAPIGQMTETFQTLSRGQRAPKKAHWNRSNAVRFVEKRKDSYKPCAHCGTPFEVGHLRRPEVARFCTERCRFAFRDSMRASQPSQDQREEWDGIRQ